MIIMIRSDPSKSKNKTKIENVYKITASVSHLNSHKGRATCIQPPPLFKFQLEIQEKWKLYIFCLVYESVQNWHKIMMPVSNPNSIFGSWRQGPTLTLRFTLTNLSTFRTWGILFQTSGRTFQIFSSRCFSAWKISYQAQKVKCLN